MKTSDLRVGNIVKHKHGDEIFEEVTESWIAPEMQKLIEETYEPIKITEEWLLRLGFKAVVGARLWFTITFTKGMQLEYDNGTFYVSGHDSHTTFLSGLEEVHKLQNFYFNYTGRELYMND